MRLVVGCLVALSVSVAGAEEQVVVVLTDGWDAPLGKLRRYERSGAAWKSVAKEVPVALGEHGLAWARGLHPENLEGPRKREGDARAPAGLFPLGRAYGRAAQPPPGSTIPYEKTNPQLRCVDDVKSEFYNQIVPLRPGAWTSDENMYWSVYDPAIVVEQNPAPAVRGAGSCVFLHVWKPANAPTAGCTVMDRGQLNEILAWLRPGARLVQLPRDVYAKVRATWQLP